MTGFSSCLNAKSALRRVFQTIPSLPRLDLLPKVKLFNCKKRSRYRCASSMFESNPRQSWISIPQRFSVTKIYFSDSVHGDESLFSSKFDSCGMNLKQEVLESEEIGLETHQKKVGGNVKRIRCVINWLKRATLVWSVEIQM